MSTEREIQDVLWGMIDNMTKSQGKTLDYVAYEGDMSVNNGSLLQLTTDTAQIGIVVGEGEGDYRYSNELRRSLEVVIQVYYQVPTDINIESLSKEYNLIKGDIAHDVIYKTFYDINSKGIPQSCNMTTLRYIKDVTPNGWEKADKYTIRKDFIYEVAYEHQADDI